MNDLNVAGDFWPLQELSLAGGSGAADGIYVPELGVLGKVLDADFTLHFGARLSQPDHAKLGLRAVILQIDDHARTKLSFHALQSCTASADSAKAGGLGEWSGVGVHAPDLYGKFDGDALLPAAIHAAMVVEAKCGNTGNRSH